MNKKAKIFFGTTGHPADEQYNAWVEENMVVVEEVRYWQGRGREHSIVIFYRDGWEF